MNKFSRIQSFLNQILFSAVLFLSIVTNVSAFQGTPPPPSGGTLSYPGSPYSATIGSSTFSIGMPTVTGITAPYTFSAPTLPGWLNLNTSDGSISLSVPSVPVTATSGSYSVTVTGTGGSANTTLMINVSGGG
ncbi:MAG: putative Ig domain, partial [Bacteroidota bacterium]